MESDPRIDKLIAELRTLCLQVARLESEVLTHRSGSATTEQHHRRAESARFFAHGYATGNRDRILNKVKKPATWDNRVERSETAAQTASVTEGREMQIFFKTDNGVETRQTPIISRKLAQPQ
jgi:hypothetical protein